MGVSFIGLIILAAIGFVVVMVISRLFRSGGGKSAPPQAAQGVTLNCPHCGQSTEASRHQCQHCNQEL